MIVLSFQLERRDLPPSSNIYSARLFPLSLLSPFLSPFLPLPFCRWNGALGNQHRRCSLLSPELYAGWEGHGAQNKFLE